MELKVSHDVKTIIYVILIIFTVLTVITLINDSLDRTENKEVELQLNMAKLGYCKINNTYQPCK